MSLISNTAYPKENRFGKTPGRTRTRKKSTATIKRYRSNIDISLDPVTPKDIVISPDGNFNESSDFIIKNFSYINQDQSDVNLK